MNDRDSSATARKKATALKKRAEGKKHIEDLEKRERERQERIDACRKHFGVKV